ncbi:MAG: DUF1697 domain-containing protein [Pseudomonadota bacterium]
MPRYVALFRGINVGKAKRIAMADLRALLARLGFSEIQTLLNSGNAVFTGARETPDKLATRLRDAVAKKLGVDALVIIKSAEDVAAIMSGNALEKLATDHSRMLVAMTNDGKALAALETVAKAEWGAEKVHAGKHAAYVWCANGILESKVLGPVLRNLDNAGTTRNWATLARIHALMTGGDER